ncbi:MAG: TrbG/VirB9 family P-type conjugative transfer protein [Fusobacteriales bacterium]|jgi:type IV secretion system protein VirB9|nr:TrbG/VirB9 family P-type conjugative transfer protein [Fusobacteriales bacterium]
MKKIILILSMIVSISASSMDRYVPTEIRDYTPPKVIETKISNTSTQIISGRDEALKKTQTTFTYNQNNVYQVYASPDFLTVFELAADEEVTFLAGGDTENWQIDEAKGGAKNATFVFIKPLEEDLATNVIITTNKRLYNIKVNSTLNEYNSLVKWNYPQTAEMIKFSENSIQTGAVIPEKINMDYMVSNKYYAFAPDKIFDDGEKTYFKMKKNMSEMPVVFLKGDDGIYSQVPVIIGNNGEIVINRTAKKFKFVLGKKSLIIVNNRYVTVH